MTHITKVDYLELIKKECIRTRLIHTLAGIFSSVFIFINSTVCLILLVPAALLRCIIPLGHVKKACMRINSIIPVIWNVNNSFLFTKILGLRIETSGEQDLSMKNRYIVISNHQSLADIIALQAVLNRRISPLRFFLKKELIWMPAIRAACRVLDFPFIKMYSRKSVTGVYLIEGKEAADTEIADSNSLALPVSLINFVEGTTFAKDKHYRQRSPYNNLLKPKAPGIGFALTMMGEHFNSILNITIKYAGKESELWSLMCGRIKHVKMHIERIPMSDKFRGNYAADPLFRKRIQKWLNDLWIKKDRMLEVM